MLLAEDLIAWLRLSLVPGLGSGDLRRLLTAFGGPEQALAASHAALARHVADPLAAAIKQGGQDEALASACAWLEQPNNSVLTLADAGYPRPLLQIPDPPPLLYVKGRANCSRGRRSPLSGAATRPRRVWPMPRPSPGRFPMPA